MVETKRLVVVNKFMSKKNLTWTAIIVLIILGLTAWWFFSRESSAVPANQPTQTSQNLFPYGTNSTSSVNNTQTNPQGTVVLGGSSATPPPALIHITTAPVSGMIFLPETASSSVTLRYIDRATGHIYDYSFGTGTSTETTETTVPKVYNGIFSNNGTRVLLQTLGTSNQIETITGSIAETNTGPVALENVTFLPTNAVSIAVNGPSLFYLVSVSSGSLGYLSALDGTKPSQIFNSALNEFISKWQGTNLTLQTKDSASVGGYFFDLNTKTGALVPILNNISGLTALENPAGTFVFGSASNGGVLQSFMYDEKSGSARTIPLSTLADKCVWSDTDPNSLYCAVPTSLSGTLPDDWYQGNVFLPDNNIWKITADTGVTNVVDFLSERNANIDAENLVLDGKGTWLAFMNKEDLTLWALRISE